MAGDIAIALFIDREHMLVVELDFEGVGGDLSLAEHQILPAQRP